MWRKISHFLSILVYENVINKNKPQINAQMKYCKYLLELFNEVGYILKLNNIIITLVSKMMSVTVTLDKISHFLSNSMWWFLGYSLFIPKYENPHHLVTHRGSICQFFRTLFQMLINSQHQFIFPLEDFTTSSLLRTLQFLLASSLFKWSLM